MQHVRAGRVLDQWRVPLLYLVAVVTWAAHVGGRVNRRRVYYFGIATAIQARGTL